MANKKTEKVAAQEQVAEATATPEATQPQLTINDLQSLSKIVDLATRRGAFVAAELTQVGEAYDKLSAFLTFVDTTQAAAATTPSQADSTVVAAE